MGMFESKIVGIDFHDYSAEIVEISIKGDRKYLEAYNRMIIPSDVIVDGEIRKKEELKIIIKSMFQNANPHPIETKTIAMTFPSSKVMTHIFKLPANLNDAEIKKAITYEAETVIPFAISDIYWDFTILEKEATSVKHSSQYVLFACINKQIADQYCDLFEEMEMIPMLFSVPCDTLQNSIPAEMLADKTNLIIDIDTLAVNYVLIKNTVVKHFFSVNEGGHKFITDLSKDIQLTENVIIDLKEKNKLDTISAAEKIATFLDHNYSRGKHIIEEFEAKNPEQKVEQIILTGKFLNLPNFKKLATTYFPNCQVLIGDPKLGLMIEPTKFNIEGADKNEYIPYSIYFNNAIGSALRQLNSAHRDGVNLLPDRLKENLDTRKKSIILSVTAILATAITLALATYSLFQFQNSSYRHSNLVAAKSAVDKTIYGTRYQEIKDQIAKFNNEVEELSIIDHSLFSVAGEAQKIYKLMPAGIRITSFTFSNDELTFDVSGIANDRNSLLEAQNNLESADFVEQVIAPISNYDEKTKISFQIKIKLSFTKLTKYGSDSATK